MLTGVERTFNKRYKETVGRFQNSCIERFNGAFRREVLGTVLILLVVLCKETRRRVDIR
jgi:hypothetical protein